MSGDVHLRLGLIGLMKEKMDSRTISCYFIGYSERSRGFKFYYPFTNTIIETNNTTLRMLKVVGVNNPGILYLKRKVLTFL